MRDPSLLVACRLPRATGRRAAGQVSIGTAKAASGVTTPLSRCFPSLTVKGVGRAALLLAMVVYCVAALGVGPGSGNAGTATLRPVIVSFTVTPSQPHACARRAGTPTFLCPAFGQSMVVAVRVKNATRCTFYSQHVPFSSLYPVKTVGCTSGHASVTLPAIANPHPAQVRLTYAVRARRMGSRPAQQRVTILEAAAIADVSPIVPTPTAPPPLPPPVVGLDACAPGPDCYYGPIYATYPDYGNIAPTNLGDCTFAAAAHWEQIVLGRHPDPTEIGYEFARAGGTLKGGLPLNALFSYWERQGIAGVFLTGLSLFPRDQATVQSKVRGYGALIVGFQFVANDGFAQHIVQAGSHVAVVDGFTPEGPLVVSWGHTLQMTWQQWNAEATSMWAVGAR